MSNMIRNLLLTAGIVVGAALAAGQAAQASPLDVIESGFSVGLGDSGVEFGIGDMSDDHEDYEWDDEHDEEDEH